MEKPLNVWVTDAQPTEDRRLLLTFNDGSVKIFDCNPLIERYPVFQPLKDKTLFHNIALDGWTVTWADGAIDIAPEYLYENSIRPYDTDEGIPLPNAAEEMA